MFISVPFFKLLPIFTVLCKFYVNIDFFHGDRGLCILLVFPSLPMDTKEQFEVMCFKDCIISI